MQVDKEKNMYYYYNQTLDICDCIYCRYFKENIFQEHPSLAAYFSGSGIDIKSPFEVDLPYLNNDGKICYTSAQYIVFGRCEEDIITYIDGIEIIKSRNYPPTNIVEEHFVIELPLVVFEEPLDDDFKREMDLI